MRHFVKANQQTTNEQWEVIALEQLTSRTKQARNDKDPNRLR